MLPRVTTAERDAIQSPAMSLLIFITDTECFEAWNSNTASWVAFGCISTVSSFSCGDAFTDSRDSYAYPTLEIGDQCWMAKNLNYIPDSGNSWCYDNELSNCAIYGRLYDWNTAMAGNSSSNTNPSGIQGICPAGWHLPSDVEWCQMENTVEPDMDINCNTTEFRGTEIGKKLKTNVWNGNNSSGFTALPAGGFFGDDFYNIDLSSAFWTATDNGAEAWYRSLFSGNDVIYRYENDKTFGFSVRCVKD